MQALMQIRVIRAGKNWLVLPLLLLAFGLALGASVQLEGIVVGWRTGGIGEAT